MKTILLGGSPCTKWSIAQKNREVTCEGEGWELFKNYHIAKELLNPDYYLYENNTTASLTIKETIESMLGNKRIEINSSIVSAQNRSRFYVSNLIPTIPESSNLTVRDILEKNVTSEKIYHLDKINENAKASRFGLIKLGYLNNSDSQGNRIYSIDGKSSTLCAASGGLGAKTGLYMMDNGDVRRLTVKEASRLQTIPDWVQIFGSSTQCYKQLGNGWTIEVIKLFLSQLPKDEEYIVLSMYDGMSCGQITLKELGINVKEYVAVEIEKNCQNTIKLNFPNTILFNDAFDIRENSELRRKILEINKESRVPRKLPFETEIPTHYCAICDGALYKDKNVMVVDGGNSAITENEVTY